MIYITMLLKVGKWGQRDVGTEGRREMGTEGQREWGRRDRGKWGQRDWGCVERGWAYVLFIVREEILLFHHFDDGVFEVGSLHDFVFFPEAWVVFCFVNRLA